MKVIVLLYVVFILLGFGCSSSAGGGKDSVNDSIVEEPERVMDSLKAIWITDIDVFNKVDSMVVVLNNPYSETLLMDNKYYIHEADSQKLIMTGSIPNIQIDPESVKTFKICLGLDSIVYTKSKSYQFTFHASGKNVDVIYYDSINVGNRYKKKDGKKILEPYEGKIYLPVLVVEEPNLDTVLTEGVVEIDSGGERNVNAQGVWSDQLDGEGE